MVHDFKYTEITPARRSEIVKAFAKQIRELIQRELRPKFPNEAPPFDRCITPPTNRPNSQSLPAQVAEELCAWESKYLTHASGALRKTRVGTIMKTVPVAERAKAVSMLYQTIPSRVMSPKYGFLVIDDVYDTGSTVEEVCRALQAEYPQIPKYVITLTHLWRSL